MDQARAQLVWRLLRIVLVAHAIRLAIGQALDFRGPDPRCSAGVPFW